MRIIRVKNVLKCCLRLYCSEKPIVTIEEAGKVNRKPELEEESSNIITDSNEDCAKFQARVIKQVLIEKEQDANLQSRLSKECKVLFPRSANASISAKSGAIRLDNLTLQKDSPDWLSYNFDQFQTHDTQSPTKPQEPTKSKAEQPTRGGEGTNIGGGGGTEIGGSGVIAVNPIRPVRGEPGKVLFTFVPEEWWRAFIPKTGVTGFGTFLFTFGTFLVSKEYYVMEHYYYHGLSMFILCAYVIKYIGPQVAEWLDQEIDEYEKAWNQGRDQLKKLQEDSIINELHCQFQMNGQLMLIEVKRENALLQLEEEYRKRQMYVYNEVKKRLDYQVEMELVRQRVQHRNLIEYVTREVIKSITPDMQDKLIYYSIDAIMQDLEIDKNKK